MNQTFEEARSEWSDYCEIREGDSDDITSKRRDLAAACIARNGLLVLLEAACVGDPRISSPYVICLKSAVSQVQNVCLHLSVIIDVLSKGNK